MTYAHVPYFFPSDLLNPWEIVEFSGDGGERRGGDGNERDAGDGRQSPGGGAALLHPGYTALVVFVVVLALLLVAWLWWTVRVRGVAPEAPQVAIATQTLHFLVAILRILFLRK